MDSHGAASGASPESGKKARKPRTRKPNRETSIESLEPRVMLSVAGDERLQSHMTMPAALSAGPEMAQTAWELIVVDPRLAKDGLLPARVSSSTKLLVLDEKSDVLSQITAALNQAGKVRAVHLLTHGSSGSIVVGDQVIDGNTLSQRSKELESWGASLTSDAVVAIYGCDVAAGESGRAFVQALAKRSSATVAASTDLTGSALRGGDWQLEYVSGNDAVRAMSFGSFDGLLATFTVTASGGAASHIVGSGASVVDASVVVSSSDGVATYTSATVTIASNLQTANDVLALPSPPAGFSSSYNSGTGVLTVTAAGGKTAAQFQAALRLVTYNNTQSSFANTSDRSISFAFQGASSSKTLSPDLPVDSVIKTRIQDAFGVIDAIGAAIVSANSQPYRNTETEVPVVDERITDLLYPNSSTLDGSGNPVPELSRSIQPATIGSYLSLSSTVVNYFNGAGAITDLTGLKAALEAKLNTVVDGNKAVLQVDAAFTKPDATDARRIDLTVTILSVKGDTKQLTLEALERDLNLRLGSNATVQTGGGADIAFTISIDLAGRVYGSGTAIPAANVGVNFTRLNAFAGYALDGETFDVEIGAIRGQVVGAAGYLGARIPVNLGGSGYTRTLAGWQTNGSDYVGFGTATAIASISLPIAASIGGVLATTNDTRIAYSDTNLFDSAAPTYTATDFEALQYFAAVRIDNVIDQILRVGDLYDSLEKSDENLFGVEVPFLDSTTMGELFDFGALFDSVIGANVDIYEPVINTPGRDELTDYRLPLSSDTTPKPAMYSDLRAGFTFGVVLNESWPVHTITVAADGARASLNDLVTDINAAFVAASVNIVASNVKDKISLKASDVSVQRFAIVPVAPAAGRLSPTSPPGDISAIALNTPQYYTVTGTTTGSVTGTNYYTVASPIAAAAVHAGILDSGETGVVKVTRIGATGALTGSIRNSITSSDAGSTTNSYLIESAVSDIRRLGFVAYDADLTVLETLNAGAVRGTLPLQANLSASGSIKITAGSNSYTVNVPDNGRTDLLDTLGDVQSALTTAGVGTSTLRARLVDSVGNVLEGDPEVGASYYLQFYIPEGSAWTTFTLAPTGDETAHMVVPLGFIAGDVASRPRPAALTTFQDFSNNTLFPDITITPVYDADAGTVTLEFAASDSASPSTKAAFDLVLGKLGKITATNDALAFTPTINSELSFGLEFKIGPEKPVSLPSGNALPANGRLTSTADFALNFVLQDTYTVSVPQAWTTANNNVQDLVSDINLALTETINGDSVEEDITDRFIARRLQDTTQLEMLTASKANAGVAYVPTHTDGVLANDLVINFSHDGVSYSVTVAAEDTEDFESFSELVALMNTALGTAVSGGQTVSLVNDFFFTTIASDGGAANSDVYLYATTPASSSWPASIVLTAGRTDSTVTQLGYDDAGEADTSVMTARAQTADAKLIEHSSGDPLASGTIDLAFPTFAGSVPYGFNTLNFAATSGGITAKAMIELVGDPVTPDEAAGALLNHVDRTLSRANGTGSPRAALVLEDITATGATIDEDATIDITIPNFSLTSVEVDEPLGVPIPVPGQLDGVLTADRTVNFLHENARYAVTVTVAESAANTSFADLVDQFNDKLETASKTVSGVTTTVDASDLFTITPADEDGQVVVSIATTTANPDFATVTFLPTLSAFGEIAAQGSFGLATVADSLTEVLPLLDALQSDLDLFSAFELPLVNAKVNELIDIKGELLSKIETLRGISISSPSQIGAAVAQALGIPNNFVGVTYDSSNNAYRIDVQWETGVATAKALNMTLADFYRFTNEEPPAGLTSFNDAGSSSPLDIKIKAITTLALGIDLTDPNTPRTFLYGHDGTDDRILSDGSANGTSVELQVEATADDISFTAALGAFGIFVRGGSANLGGAARTFGSDPIYTFDDETKQLHYARDEEAAVLSVTLGEVGEKYYLDPDVNDEDAFDTRNYETAFEGTVEANLPLFTPTEFINPFTNRQMNVRIEGEGMTTVTPGGNIFQLLVGDLQSYADASLNLIAWQRQISDVYAIADGDPLTTEQQEVIDDLQTLIDGLQESEVLEIFTPDDDDANSGVRAPTLLDLVRDPAILVDGIDVALGAIETGLRALDNLNIPVIGSVLGDAVDGVFDWRRGWLLDLKHDLRGQGEAFFETLKDNVYDFLGPGGIDLLLKDNGIRSVDGMIKADSRDDITLDFLDEEGNKMTGLGGYGAEAVEFKVRLGQVLLDTGADISFNFDSLQPALSLGINGGLTFKLGWDMTIGFGVSLSDGFYVVTDSDPVANELELRFEAGTSGEQVGFTVAERAGSISGWSVMDAAGGWVRGPRQGDGSSEIIDVMPVDVDGNDYDFNQGLPPTPDECAAEVAAGQPQRVYWVVAMEDDLGDPQPAYLDQLGQYRPMAGDDWSDVNGGDDDRNPDMMVQYNQTAPFAAYGSLFAFNLTAIDNIRTGLTPIGDAEYFYDGTKPQITAGQRNDADDGVNRNNQYPTRIAGRIGVNISDPSAAAEDYVARPGPTASGFMLMDGANPLGGEPVLDDNGMLIPVRLVGDDWYVLEPEDAEDPSSELVEAFLINEDQSPNRITFSEIQEAGTSIFELKINAEAVVNLKLTLTVSENANIPRITAELNIDWRTDSMKPPANPFAQEQEQKRDLIPEVGVNNIRLDLGAFLTKFIKPIAEEVDKTMKPLDPLIDVLMASLPVLSDIAGRPIRLTTLLSTFGGPKGQAVATVIEMVVLVRQLSGVMAGVPDNVNVYLPIGNFWLAKVGAGPGGQPGMGTQIYYDNNEVTAPSISQRNQSMIANSAESADHATKALAKIDGLDKGSSSQPGVATQDRGGFTVPLLQDPMTVFKLMMGQNVPLVTFSLPKLNFTFDQSIPLIKIFVLEVGLRVAIQAKGQLAVGYDTYGLKLFKDSGDPEDLLEGFYVSDRANADGTGADVDEFYLRATIALYGGVDLYLAKAGIEGGFNFTASINLNDPDNDGKLRVMEAVELVSYTGNPLDLADLHFSGDIYARYYYWVGLKIWTPWKTYKVTLVEGGKTFARMQLFSFTREGRDGPPVVATKVTTVLEDGTEQPDSLLVHIGPNSAKRISNEDPLKLKDAAEHVIITNDPDNVGTVTVRYANYGTYSKTFTGISRLVIHGGEGNDTIDASGVTGIPVEFDGGAGNDTIYLGSGSTTIDSLVKGGLGNDVIRVTAGGRVRIEGDEGNDSIEAGTGNATIDGGGGNDTITAGSGNNQIDFSKSFGKDNLVLNSLALVNLLNFIDSSLPLQAKLQSANSTVKAGDTNSATFDFSKVTEIRGSDGRDTFDITDPTTGSANGSKGVVISGGPSDDTYNINANDVSAMHADGITIDDDIEPLTEATIGDIEVDECGHLREIQIDNPGLGYVQPPDVIITDSTGTGARAVAGIDKNGKVTGIFMLSKGDNYSANPTITLVRAISTGDKINFNSQTQHTVAIDQQGNGAHDHQLKLSGKAFKWVGYEDQGEVREIAHDVNEIDRVSVTLPNAKLEINDAIDLQDKFEVVAREFDQRAPITADVVNITTDRGFAADYPINATNNGDVVLRVTGKLAAGDIPVPATATAIVVDGIITGFNITNGGSGYRFAPTVEIADARGAGARATAVLTNGVVTGITLIDGGSGYLTTPAPVISIAHPDSIQLNNNLSSSTVGSLPGDGDGRGTVTLRAEAGMINQSGDVFFPDGSQILWEHGDYRYTSSNKLDEITPAAYPATTGGSGATATAVLDSDGRVTAINVVNGGTGYSRDFLPTVKIQGAATATAIVDNGAITGFKITYPGEGYAFAPTVTIVSNGFGKLVGSDADSTALNRSHIKSAGGSLIATAYSGIGSGSKPLKTDVENMVAQTFDDGSAIYVLEKDGVNIGLMDHINGINTVNGNIGVTTFGGTISLGQPVQQMNASGELLWQDANKTIPIYAKDENGAIIYKGGRLTAGDAEIKLTADDIDINSYISATGGKLTVQPTQPDAAIGLNGTQARATAAISNGQVTGVSELWSGRGYTSLPLVTIAPPGERAFGVANVYNGQLQNINVTFGGTKYNASNLPEITLEGGGLNGGDPTEDASVTAIYNSDGVVTGVTINDGGAGYYTAPKVTFKLPGTQALATAQVINGRISEVQILNPGSNYTVAPEIKISAPYQFSLEQEEVEYLQDGFENIVIGRADGRHTFHSANAGFVDGVTLRGPREGGTVEMENIRSSDGPVVIIGSGHTLNLTTVSPFVSGTFVEIDDNIVVHDDVNAVITGTTSYVSIFGAGKGKIDGVAGSDDENLTINDVGNVLVTGAIGSTYPINDLTINSSGAGTINLQSTVAIEGDLHIVEGGDITFGGNMVIGGNLIIDEGVSVSFAGTVTVGGDLIIRKATTVTFAKNVSVGGDVAIGELGDPSKIEGVTFASTARLDCAGGVEIYTSDEIVFGNRIGQITAPAYVTLRSDLSDISFQSSVNVPAGAVTIIKARDVTFAQELTADSLDIQDASGQTRFERATVLGTMSVISTSLVQIKNRLDISIGSATLTTNDVDFSGGNGSINYIGNATSTLTIRPRTVARDITIGSPPGVFSSLDISDVDLAAIGATFTELAIGNSASGTGTVTIGSIGSQQGAGNSQLVTSTRIHGGTINVVQAIDSAATTGFLKMVARTGHININARINGTVAERNAEIELETLVGGVNINQPVHATDEMRIISAGSVTEGASGYVDVPNLAITAGGVVTMNHASNSISTLAIDAGNHAIGFRNDTAFVIGTVDVVSGINSGSTDTTLTSVGGTVTQTQPITAAGLLLQGTGGTFTLNNGANDIDRLAADTQAVSFTDVDDVTVDTVGAKNGIATVGNTTVTAGTDITIGQPIVTTTGNIVLDANGGNVSAGALGDLTTGGTGTITIDATDDITLNDITSGGALTARAENSLSLIENITAGGAVLMTADGGDFAQASGKSLAATGPVTITASQSVTTRTISAAGDLSATAGTGASIQGPLTTTAGGEVTIAALGGDATMGTGASINGASDTTITATVDVTTDAITSAGTTTVTAGGEVSVVDNITTTDGGSVAITAQGGSITMGAPAVITSDANVTLNATDDLVLTTINALGDLVGNADDAIALSSTFDVGGIVTLDAANGDVNMVAPAAIDAGGATTITATDDINVQTVVSAGLLTVDAGNNIDIAVRAATTGGAAIVINAQGGDVTMGSGSEIISDSTLGITATQQIQVTDVSANGNATLSAGTSVQIDVGIETDSAGTLDITALGGAITMADGSTIDADGDTNLSATTTITTETVTVAGDLTMTAPGAIAAEGNITTTDLGTVAITSSGSTFTQSAGTTINSAGTVDIEATTATLETVTAAGAVDVDASNAVNLNEAINTTNAGTVTISAAAGAFTMSSDAEINAAGATDIDAGTTATIQSLDAAGAVDIDAAGTVLINEALATTAGGTVDVTSTSGAITMADASVLTAAGATTLTAGTTITTETVSAAGDLTMLAAGAIAAEGDITTTNSGDVSITSSGSTFTQSPATTITSASTVTITATNATIETITAAGAVDTQASGAIALNEAINTTAGGTVTLNAAAGSFTMSSDSEINAAGAVDIDAGTTATIQSLDAAGNVDVDAVGTVLINEALATTSAGTVDVTSTAGAITMVDNSVLNAAGATTLTAGTTITTETVDVAGDLTMLAAGAIAAEANITTTNSGDIDITSTGSTFTQSPGTTMTSASTVTITATNATIETITAAGAVDTQASGSIALNEAINTTAGGTVTLNAASGAFTMSSDAEINAAGAVDIDADTTATLQSLDAAGNVAVDAGLSITINDSLATTAGGTVDLTSTSGAITMADGAVLNADGDTTLSAGATITTETVDVAGDLTMTAAGAINAEGNITTTENGNVSITSTSGAFTQTTGMTITSDGTTDITAASATIETIAGTGAVDVQTTGAIALNEAISTTAGSVTIASSAGGFTMSNDSEITAAGAVDIDAGTTATIQSLDAAGNVTIDADTGITLNDVIATTAGGTIALTSSDGAIDMQDDTRIVSDGATTLTADTAIGLVDVTSAGDLIATAGGSIALEGEVITTDDSTATFTATAGQILMANGSILTADGDVEMTAGTNITTTAVSAAGDVTATAGTGISVLGTIGTTADGHVILDANNGAIAMALAAAIDADGDATLTASGAITASDVVADDEIQITAGTNFTLTGAIVSANGPIAVTAQAGDLVMVEDTTITSGGLTTLIAGGDISTETIGSAGKITIAAGEGATLNGGLTTSSGAMVAITADDGSITMVDPAFIAAAGAITMTASEDITTLGIAAGADISLTAGEDANLDGNIESDQDLFVVTQNGAITQATNATIVVGGVVDMQSADTISTSTIDAVGNVELNATNAVTTNATVQSRTGAISITSDDASITMAAGSLSAAGAVTLNAGTTLLLRPINAGGISLVSGTTTTLQGQLATTGGGTVTINAGGVLVIEDAANISSDGAVTLTAAGGIQSNADIGTSNDNITINSPFVLADDISMSTGRRGAGSIAFNSTINGARTLSLRTGSDIGFNGAVGQTTPLSMLTILAARNVSIPVAFTAGAVEQVAGSGTTTISGTLAANGTGISIRNVMVDLTGALGTTAGVPVNLEGSAVRVARTGRLWSGGKLTMTADDIDLVNGYKVGVSGGYDMVLSADDLELGSRADALAGTGLIVLQPISTTAAIDIGNDGAGFDITAAEIGAIAVGAKKVIIGRGADTDYDSGDAGQHTVRIGDASFRAPVSIRATADQGTIAVNGTLSSQGRLSNIQLSSGGDVAVHGAVKIGRSGHVFITSDVDHNGRGAVRVAESTNASVTTPNGNILLVGPAVRAGGTRTWANIVSANSSVFLGTTASRSSVVITNPKTTIAGNDVLFGGNGRVHPALISVEGNITTTEDLNLYSAGDIELKNFRLIGEDTLNIIADNDVTATNGSLIGRKGMVSIRPDTDKNGAGAATTSDVRLSQPTTLDLRSRVSEVRLPVQIIPGSKGEAYVAVGNNTKQTVTGLVNVYVYSSTDGELGADDKVIGTGRRRITLLPGEATTFRVDVQIPTNAALGSYRVIAEAMPYAQVDSTVGSNISTGGLISVVAPAA